MPSVLPSGFKIRALDLAEIGLTREWAAAEGWNPGLHDAPCFHAADPGGFLLGEIDGRPVGCVSAVAYDDGFAFLGLYIIRPGFRGKGYGMALWDAAMSRLGGRNVGLDGVVAQQGNYRKSGFRFAYDNVRYRAIGGGPVPAGFIPLSDVPFEEVNTYDRRHFPAPRPAFLRHWLSRPGSVALGVVRDGRLIGYGVLRPSIDGFRVGPLFADGPEVAFDLFRGLLAHAPGAPVFIDVPDDTANPHAPAFAQRFNLVETFRTARMYTRGRPPLPLDRVYGVTSLELG